MQVSLIGESESINEFNLKEEMSNEQCKILNLKKSTARFNSYIFL